MEKKTSPILIITLVLFMLATIGLSSYLVYDKFIKKEENTVVEPDKEEENSYDNNTSSLSVVEATQIVQDLYSNAYQSINSNWESIWEDNNYTINGKQYYKVNLTELSKYFSSKIMEKIKLNLIFYNNEYYDLKSKVDDNDEIPFHESLSVYQNLFGSTDQKMRQLTLKSFNDDIIVAEGQSKNVENGDSDQYPLYLILIKENNNWVIDYFNYDNWIIMSN